MSKKDRIRREKTELIKNIQTSTGRGYYITAKQLKYIKQEITTTILEDALARVLLCAATVIDHDFGKLQKRETRLKNFCEIIKGYLEHVDKPTAEMEAAGKRLYRDTGIGIKQ